jgi:hypothetical protein
MVTNKSLYCTIGVQLRLPRRLVQTLGLDDIIDPPVFTGLTTSQHSPIFRSVRNPLNMPANFMVVGYWHVAKNEKSSYLV